MKIKKRLKYTDTLPPITDKSLKAEIKKANEYFMPHGLKIMSNGDMFVSNDSCTIQELVGTLDYRKVLSGSDVSAEKTVTVRMGSQGVKRGYLLDGRGVLAWAEKLKLTPEEIQHLQSLGIGG